MYRQKTILVLLPCPTLLSLSSSHVDNGIQLILREQVGAVFDEDLSPDCFDDNTVSSGSDDKIFWWEKKDSTTAFGIGAIR